MNSNAPAPDAAEDTPGAYCARVFTRLARKLLEVLDRLEANPLDDEAVHDARVACRRLRVGVRIIRPHLRGRKRLRRLGESLRALRTALGAARETEVALATLAALRPDLSGDVRFAADALAASLALRHEELRNGAGPALHELGLPRFRKRLRRIVDDLAPSSSPPPDEASPPAPGPGLAVAAREAAESARRRLLDLPPGPIAAGDDEALHRLRIEGKKLRYTLEFFEPVFAARIGARLRLLRDVQDQLGEIHDLADLRTRLHALVAVARRLKDGRLMIGYEALGAMVDRRRTRRLRGVERLQAAAAHPGFVPQTRGAGGGAPADPESENSESADPGAPLSEHAVDPADAAGGPEALPSRETAGSPVDGQPEPDAPDPLVDDEREERA